MFKYTLNENIDSHIYTAEFTFSENVTRYIYNEDFQIIITDLFSTDELIIDSDTIDDYGLIKTSDKSTQIVDSLIAHKGLLIYFPAFNKMTIKMLPKCSNYTETIGFYSSSIFVSFDGETEHKQARFHSSLFPKIVRDKEIIQYKDYDDPILPEQNIRPGYNFNTETEKERIKADFKYNSESDLYVNSDTLEEYKEGVVPTYISYLTAYMLDQTALEDYEFEFDWNNAKSYIINNETGSTLDIPYKILGIETEYINVIADYYVSVTEYKIVQEIYTESKGRWDNKLVFDIGIIDPENIIHDHIISETDDEDVRSEDDEDYFIEESIMAKVNNLLTEVWENMITEDGEYMVIEDFGERYKVLFESPDDAGHVVEECGQWIVTGE